jgi:hypothetical protein
MAQPQISIVTGTFNRITHLQHMVTSARGSFMGKIEFVLVDGGSTDGTLEWCREQPDVVLIEHGELLGAVKSFNDGFKAATGRYVIIANDDVWFVGTSIAAAFGFMETRPDVGIGAFYQDRSGKHWHIDHMPARNSYGQPLSAVYGQVCIIPREYLIEWGGWGEFGARTYAGDNYLSARCWESGFRVEPIPDAFVHDTTPMDALRELNNPPRNSEHPDTAAYLKIYPQGPTLPRQFKTREISDKSYRVLYAPIFEEGHKTQHQQKVGLKRALQRLGLLWQVDYTAGESFLNAARQWKPDLCVLQLHDSKFITLEQAQELRTHCGKIINWNGDVYDRSYDDVYVQCLRLFDLQTSVNANAVREYASKGIKAAYWQCAYEPTGVGYEPDADTPKHDIIFMGNGYSVERKRIGAFIDSVPYSAAIYGTGWERPTTPNLYDFAQGCKLYRNSKIALGDSQWHDSAPGFVSNRLFQVLAAGGALMMQQEFAGREEYLGLKDGVHLVTWTDHADLRTKVDYYLTHEKERLQIVKQGQAFCLREHSFEARVNQLRKLLNV